MPTHIAVDHERRIASVEVTGHLEIAEMLGTVDEVARQIAGNPGYSVLSDHRALETPLTPEQATQLLAHLSVSGGALIGAKWAIVVSKPASYGMMRLLSARAEELPMSVQAFWDRDEATAWLTGGPSTLDSTA